MLAKGCELGTRPRDAALCCVLRGSLPLLGNALKAPVLRFFIQAINYSSNSVIADRRLEFAPSVH